MYTGQKVGSQCCPVYCSPPDRGLQDSSPNVALSTSALQAEVYKTVVPMLHCLRQLSRQKSTRQWSQYCTVYCSLPDRGLQDSGPNVALSTAALQAEVYKTVVPMLPCLLQPSRQRSGVREAVPAVPALRPAPATKSSTFTTCFAQHQQPSHKVSQLVLLSISNQVINFHNLFGSASATKS